MQGFEKKDEGLWLGRLPPDGRRLVWTVSAARKPNKCALSGKPILRGDRVYKPITNSDQRMKRILASELDAE